MDVFNRFRRMVNIERARIVFICLMILVLPACGGGGGSSGGASSGGGTGTGVFLDSAVEGISYVSGSVSGITDANGTFTYEVGSVVRFMIGDVVIGEALGQSVITPIDLVSGSDASHPTVLNIVCFLLTLDEDGDPDNGIQISEMIRNLAQGKSIYFAQNTNLFAADGNVQTVVSELTAVTAAGARTLVTSSYSQSHLSSTIWGYFAGDYTGTFSGDDSGSFNATILPDGSITGTGTSGSVGVFTVSGQLSTNGTITFALGGTSTSANFTGSIAKNRTLSGTWINSSTTGSFSGQRASTTGGDTDGSSTGDGGGGDAGSQGSMTLTGGSLSYIAGSYTPSSATKIATTITWTNGWANYLSDGFLWTLSIAFSNDTGSIQQISFQWTGSVGSTLESVVYSCAAWSSDYDCNNATIDISNRRATFTGVALQDLLGGTPSVILNGALEY